MARLGRPLILPYLHIWVILTSIMIRIVDWPSDIFLDVHNPQGLGLNAREMLKEKHHPTNPTF